LGSPPYPHHFLSFSILHHFKTHILRRFHAWENLESSTPQNFSLCPQCLISLIIQFLQDIIHIEMSSESIDISKEPNPLSVQILCKAREGNDVWLPVEEDAKLRVAPIGKPLKVILRVRPNLGLVVDWESIKINVQYLKKTEAGNAWQALGNKEAFHPAQDPFPEPGAVQPDLSRIVFGKLHHVKDVLCFSAQVDATLAGKTMTLKAQSVQFCPSNSCTAKIHRNKAPAPKAKECAVVPCIVPCEKEKEIIEIVDSPPRQEPPSDNESDGVDTILDSFSNFAADHPSFETTIAVMANLSVEGILLARSRIQTPDPPLLSHQFTAFPLDPLQFQYMHSPILDSKSTFKSSQMPRKS
jgi:hypothetical protein